MSDLPPTPFLDLKTPWMNAAGSLGFAPDAHGPVAFQSLGAFVTNPISARPRRASVGPRLLEYPGGVLLHSGLPNLGLRGVLKKHAGVWARVDLPIIVHLMAENGEELRKMVLQLENVENVAAVEVGVPADAAEELAVELLQAAQGELPVICQIALPRALELGETMLAAGASAISLGPPRGTLPGPSGKLVSGRLYGPAIYPQALEIVRLLAKLELPVIAAGGIDSQEKGESMLAAGALAVQIDVGLWRGME